MNMKEIRILLIIFFLFSFGLVFNDTADAALRKKGKTKSAQTKTAQSKGDINVLITLSKDRGAMADDLDEDTKNYENLKKAFDDSRLKEGESELLTRKEYGEPVIILPEENGKFSRWVYKAAKTSFFSQEKIYLIFDKEKKLIRWEMPKSGR